MPEENSKIVYSTDKPIVRKERPPEDRPAPAVKPSEQRVIVRLDRKGRGGKSVTVIEGLMLSQADREALLRRLKAGLGTGGTERGQALEIQGDHCGALITALTNMGYRPKRSGG